MNSFDIAICGAGPVGQTLALLLIKRGIHPERIALIDAKTAKQANKDQRTIALSYGSQQILQTASAWPVKATEIHQIHVSRRGHLGRTMIDRKEYDVPALGYVARYSNILDALTIAFQRCTDEVHFLRPVTVTHTTQTDEHVEIQLRDHPPLRASIVVQAEGGFFHEQTRQARHHDYQQTAVIAHVKTNKPIAGRAYERFTDQGPLALLPQDDGYALVWCVLPDKAAELLALNDAMFLTALQTTFGERLGRFTYSTARFSFPLGLNAQTSPPLGRCIQIGNASQTLHPVAGQGLNLGLRDAFQLARCLSKALDPSTLQHFFKLRQSDRNQTIQLTDQFASIFTSPPDGNLKQILLSSGLGLVDLCASARYWLAQQMMFGYRA